MSDIFVSYARSTEPQAKRVAEALRGLGYNVWRDDELPAHRSFSEVIEERLKAARAVVVIWSAEAAKSEWVQSEADRARTDRKLVQISVDGAPLPMPFDRIQCADLSGWSGDIESAGWKKVADSIADLVRGGAQAAAAPEPTRPRSAHRASICVLPFANMSDDPQQEYFSDGISEDIITDLSKVSALGVIARNTAFTFKGRSVKVPDVARELDVSHVLEGSVRKAGGRVRITAQLIDGASGEHAWAERYDRDLDDIFAVQDEISEAIVTALKLKLLPQEKKAIERRGTDSAEAYDLYLMARSYGRTGNDGDPRQQEAIERLSRQAVEIDPGYALAWVRLAGTQHSLRFSFGRVNDGGQAALDRALALDPNLADAHALKAAMLALAGKQAEAEAEIAIALRLDPESFSVNNNAALIRYRQGQLEDAARHFEKVTALDETALQGPAMLVSCYTALGDAENARRAARIALERAEKVVTQDRSNGHAMANGAFALAALSEADRAKDWMRRALLVDPDNQNMRYNFACALATSLNDPAGALDMLGPVLERDTGGHFTRHAPVDPDLARLRDDPRFQAMTAAAAARLAAATPTEGAPAPESA
jgi:adenylate cyclase